MKISSKFIYLSLMGYLNAVVSYRLTYRHTHFINSFRDTTIVTVYRIIKKNPHVNKLFFKGPSNDCLRIGFKAFNRA